MYARCRVGIVKSELVVRGSAPDKFITNRGLELRVALIICIIWVYIVNWVVSWV